MYDYHYRSNEELVRVLLIVVNLESFSVESTLYGVLNGMSYVRNTKSIEVISYGLVPAVESSSSIRLVLPIFPLLPDHRAL